MVVGIMRFQWDRMCKYYLTRNLLLSLPAKLQARVQWRLFPGTILPAVIKFD